MSKVTNEATVHSRVTVTSLHSKLFVTSVLLGLALRFCHYPHNVHFSGGTLFRLTVFRMLTADCDMIVWWRRHKALVPYA